jgi:hypothetical protein
MGTKPEMLNNMRKSMSTTGVTFYLGRLGCIVTLRLQLVSHIYEQCP